MASVAMRSTRAQSPALSAFVIPRQQALGLLGRDRGRAGVGAPAHGAPSGTARVRVVFVGMLFFGHTAYRTAPGAYLEDRRGVAWVPSGVVVCHDVSPGIIDLSRV